MTISDNTVFEGPLRQLARSAWQLLLLIGVLAVALGVIVLAWPGKTLFVAGVLFGIYLVVSGIGYVFAAFGTHTGAAMRVLTFITGIVSLVLGFFCFRDKFEAVTLLAIWIGISWLFRGMTLLAAALSFDQLPGRGWQVLSGLIIVIGGAVLIVSPLDSIAILTLVAGCWLIAIGIVDVITRVPGSQPNESLTDLAGSPTAVAARPRTPGTARRDPLAARVIGRSTPRCGAAGAARYWDGNRSCVAVALAEPPASSHAWKVSSRTVRSSAGSSSSRRSSD